MKHSRIRFIIWLKKLNHYDWLRAGEFIREFLIYFAAHFKQEKIKVILNDFHEEPNLANNLIGLNIK